MMSQLYIAFLRGINVGGKNTVSMKELVALFEKQGCKNVRTVLNSGNVIFTSPEADEKKLLDRLESALQEKWQRPIRVVLRTGQDIKTLVAASPFEHVPVTPNTRLYVTFLSQTPPHQPAIPSDSHFRILRTTDTDVCSVLELAPGEKTPELMSFLEKLYGKDITTRNWNTIGRLAKLIS